MFGLIISQKMPHGSNTKQFFWEMMSPNMTINGL